MINESGAVGGMTTGRGNEKYLSKNHPSANLSTKKSKLPGLKSNLGPLPFWAGNNYQPVLWNAIQPRK
jgi:hypothetical protein